MVVVLLLLGALAVATACAVARADAGAASAARLTLDGATFTPELASTTSARGKGLMNRSTAPKDGMLFVFPRPTASAFWMKNTLVPLAITFFDAAGKRVSRLLMKPCRRDPCKIYDPATSTDSRSRCLSRIAVRRSASARRASSGGS